MSHGKPPATVEDGLRMSLRLVNGKASYYARRCTELENGLKRLTDYCAWVADGGMPLEMDEAVRDARALLEEGQ